MVDLNGASRQETTTNPGAVLVTGATGFLGSHIVAELAGAGRAVLAADLTPAPPPVRSLWADRDQLIDTAVLDVEDASALEELLASAPVEAVIHAAALTGASGATAARLHAVNVVGTQHVLAAAAAARCRRVLLVSSASVYAPAPDGAVLNEAAPKRRTDAYATSKLAAEDRVSAARRAGRDVASARVAACYGPLERVTGSRFSMSIVHRAVTAARAGRRVRTSSPAATFDLTYVGDSAATLVRLATAPVLRWEIYNVSSGIPVSLGELAATVNRCVGVDSIHTGSAEPFDLTPPPGSRRGALDVRRVREIVACTPTGLADGLSAYLSWLAEHDF